MSYDASSSFFSRLIETGEFRVNEEGHALLNGQFLLMIPPTVIIHLEEKLEEEYGRDEMEEVLTDMGRYQAEQALDRYIDRYGMDNLSREKFLDYARKILRTLGWGKVTIDSLDAEQGTVKIVVEHPTLPSVYRNQREETADKPICLYLQGIFAYSFGALMDDDLDVEETSCAAVGGKKCVFEGTTA